MKQLQLPLKLMHTPATKAGEASVWSCRYCGACICHGEKDKPCGPCPSCAVNNWSRQSLPVSVFRPVAKDPQA